MENLRWHQTPKNEAHRQLFDHVRQVERDQFDLFDRFAKLAALYDPNSPWAVEDLRRRDKHDAAGIVSENVVATNVDTVAAAIAAQEVRARFLSDGADWSTQRLYKHLEWYAEQLDRTFDADAASKRAFAEGAEVKGTGVVFHFVDHLGRIVCQQVPIDDVIVDERECRGGRQPKQLAWRRIMDRDELAAEFPEHAEHIAKAQTTANPQRWAGYRPYRDDEVVCIYAWRLAIGVKGKPGYVPGRFVVALEDRTLHDVAYDRARFPLSRVLWAGRAEAWYGIGLAERIAGHQRTLNRSNLQIERMIDQSAFVTTFVRPGDAGLAAKTINKIGTIAVYKDELPKVFTPPAVHPEQYKRHQDVRQSAIEEAGVSRMAAYATKPAGLDSGRALREHKDQATQRFAMQEKAYERFKLEVILGLIECCQELGDKAPKLVRASRYGTREIPWEKVDIDALRTKIAAASNLNRTPAGREQTLIEWAQAGVISTDDFRRLIGHPDLERAMSLYTAAMEDVDECLEAIADGEIVVPEPYMNLAMCVARGQNQYLLWNRGQAPEEVLENLRQFIVQAAETMSRTEQAAPAPMPAAPPQAALASQAMDTMAG